MAESLPVAHPVGVADPKGAANTGGKKDLHSLATANTVAVVQVQWCWRCCWCRCSHVVACCTRPDVWCPGLAACDAGNSILGIVLPTCMRCSV